jgi:hypothetical protein
VSIHLYVLLRKSSSEGPAEACSHIAEVLGGTIRDGVLAILSLPAT